MARTEVSDGAATQQLPEYWEYQVDVPPIKEHERLVEHALVELCYPSGDRLYELLRSHFYWNCMYRDCQCIAYMSLPR